MSMNVKENRYLIATTIIMLLLGSLMSFLFYKYFPFLFHTTIYYCQEFIQSFNLLSLPKNSNLLILFSVVPLFVIVFIRLVMTMFHLFQLHYRLQLNQVRSFDYLSDTFIERLGLTGKIAIINNNSPLALCFGFFKPKIYISTKLIEMTTTEEQKVILRHEKHHLDQKDNITMLFAQIIQNIFPFIPLLKDLVLNFRIERELEADRAAISDSQKTPMISTLRKLLLFENSSQLAFIPSIASTDTLEARIQWLVKSKVYKGQYQLNNIIMSSISMIILALLTITPVHAIEFHDNGKDSIMACVSNDQCAQWCKENSSHLQSMSASMSISIPYSSIRFSQK